MPKPTHRTQIDEGAGTRDSSADRPPDNSELNQAIGSALRRALRYFGPDSVVESLLYVLEVEHSVVINEVITSPASLSSGLSTMFGAASHVVEDKIAAEFANILGIVGDGKSLQELIEFARNGISTGRSTENI